MRDIYHEDLEALSDSLIEMTRLVGGAMGRFRQQDNRHIIAADFRADRVTFDRVVAGLRESQDIKIEIKRTTHV